MSRPEWPPGPESEGPAQVRGRPPSHFTDRPDYNAARRQPPGPAPSRSHNVLRSTTSGQDPNRPRWWWH